jgi:hypothetical protein
MSNAENTMAATAAAAGSTHHQANDKYHTKNGAMDKLTSINYQAWRNKFIPLLKSMNALRIVQGEEDEPAPGNSAAARAAAADYEKRSGKAATAILLSCSEEVTPFVEGMEDPRLMWDTLHERFNSARHNIGRTTILRLFQSARPTPGEAISSYFGRLLKFRQQLAGTDKAISDSALKTHIFTTLPEDFNITIQFLMLEPEEKLSVNDVMDALRNRDEARRLTELNKVSENNTAATSGEAMYAALGRPGHLVRCTFCHKNGHTFEQCFRRNRLGPGGSASNFSNKQRVRKEITCYYCGGKGHIKFHCPKKQRTFERDEEAKASASLAVGESDSLDTY